MLVGVREHPWRWPGLHWTHRAELIQTPEAPAPIEPAPPAVDVALVAARAVQLVGVCDDDLPYIRFIERLLADTGATVLPVTTLDNEEAVRVIAGSGCDAALIDLRLYNDDLAGLTLIRKLREHPVTSRMPLRMVSGAVRELKRYEEMLHEYRCPSLAKPFDPEALLASLGLAHADRAA